MRATLDKSALFEAMNAFWDAETGNDKGVEAAIVAYLDRVGLTGVHEIKLKATAERNRRLTASHLIAAE